MLRLFESMHLLELVKFFSGGSLRLGCRIYNVGSLSILIDPHGVGPKLAYIR